VDGGWVFQPVRGNRRVGDPAHVTAACITILLVTLAAIGAG
jgi:hypothetical protein